jgi:hypothetical protein
VDQRIPSLPMRYPAFALASAGVTRLSSSDDHQSMPSCRSRIDQGMQADLLEHRSICI